MKQVIKICLCLFPSLFLQVELASPCRIYIYHFRDFSSLYCCRVLLKCLTQYDFASRPFCFIALEAVVPALVLQCYFYSPEQSSAVFLASVVPLLVRQSLYSRQYVQSRVLDQNLFPRWPWEKHWDGFLTRYRWLTSLPLTTCKHLLSKLFPREFQLPSHRCLFQDAMHRTSRSPGLSLQRLPCVLGGIWGFAAAWSLVGGDFCFSANAPLMCVWICISTWTCKKVAHCSHHFQMLFLLSSLCPMEGAIPMFPFHEHTAGFTTSKRLVFLTISIFCIEESNTQKNLSSIHSQLAFPSTCLAWLELKGLKLGKFVAKSFHQLFATCLVL